MGLGVLHLGRLLFGHIGQYSAWADFDIALNKRGLAQEAVLSFNPVQCFSSLP
jgi:hypothetical protein